MSDLNISTDWNAYVESLPVSDDVKEALLTESSGGTIDFSDPTLQAYFEMAYLQFMAYIDPTLSQSWWAEVMEQYGSDATLEEQYQVARDMESDDFNSQFDEYASTHIGVLATGAAVDNNDETDPLVILEEINAYVASQSDYNYINEEADALLDSLDLDNENMLRYVVGSNESAVNFQMFAQDQILYATEQFSAISDAVATGSISAEVASGQYNQVNATIQLWTGFLQNSMSQQHIVLETFSNLLKAEGEVRQQLNANIKSPAA